MKENYYLVTLRQEWFYALGIIKSKDFNVFIFSNVIKLTSFDIFLTL